MKKQILLLLTLLVVFFVLMSFLGRKSHYVAERALWKINQRLSKAAIDPKIIPDSQFDKIADDYLQFAKTYDYTNLDDIAVLLAGRVMILRKQYDRAREIFESILRERTGNTEVVEQALSEIGRSHYLEENWSKVIDTYNRILDEYPYTDLGLKTPILVAEFYSQRKQAQSASKAFDKAIDYYQTLIKQQPATPVAFKSLRLLANCYLAKENWSRAIDIFEDILMNYSGREYFNLERTDRIVKTINTLSVVRLKDYDRPLAIYRDFVAAYPEHPYRKIMSEIIASLEKLQSENIGISVKDQ